MPRWPERRRSARWGLVALLLCAAGASAAPGTDLLQVYAQARASDPVLAAAHARLGAAQAGSRAARGTLLPQWTLDWQYRQQQGAGNARERELNSRISQVLVNLERLAQLRSATHRAEGQTALLQFAEQDLALRVAEAYFGVLGAQAQLDTVQANEEAFADQVRQAEVRAATGLGAQADVEQARTYLALARNSSIAAARELQSAGEALAEITGAPANELRPLGRVLPTSAPVPREPAAWVESALRDNPGLLAERLALEASEADLASARAAHLPTLSLSLDSGRSSQWGEPIPGTSARSATTLGLTLTLPLSAGGSTEALRRQAAYQRDAARETLEQRRRQVERSTREQHAAVLSTMTQIDATRTAVEAATKALAATQAGQILGTRSMTDLLLAIQNQTMAQNAYSQARHQYVLARLRLQRAAGAADESQLAAINALLEP